LQGERCYSATSLFVCTSHCQPILKLITKKARKIGDQTPQKQRLDLREERRQGDRAVRSGYPEGQAIVNVAEVFSEHTLVDELREHTLVVGGEGSGNGNNGGGASKQKK
jgi:hypothetical protein